MLVDEDAKSEEGKEPGWRRKAERLSSKDKDKMPSGPDVNFFFGSDLRRQRAELAERRKEQERLDIHWQKGKGES